MSLICRQAPADHVARTARAHNLPGRRTIKAIRELRNERAARRAVPTQLTTPEDRLRRHYLAAYVPVIRSRGGDVTIDDKTRSAHLCVLDRRGGLAVLGADGWRHYSSRTPARHVSLRYLVGQDDNGPWAVRIPGTIDTVSAALDAITPADVRHAHAAGRRTDRQGDIYAIETTQQHDAPTGWIGADTRWNTERTARVTSHHWDAETRTLTHHPEDGRPHRPLHLPHPVRFVQQSTLSMVRGGGRGPAD
ncbi:MAG TPA: hypothetical protein VFP72_18340 [Kineosporiaceae bacterium]|nr:hypothetical protein [Kineosporiaceae bacterium]